MRYPTLEDLYTVGSGPQQPIEVAEYERDTSVIDPRWIQRAWQYVDHLGFVRASFAEQPAAQGKAAGWTAAGHDPLTGHIQNPRLAVDPARPEAYQFYALIHEIGHATCFRDTKDALVQSFLSVTTLHPNDPLGCGLGELFAEAINLAVRWALGLPLAANRYYINSQLLKLATSGSPESQCGECLHEALEYAVYHAPAIIDAIRTGRMPEKA